MASTITYAENTARRILSGTGALALVPYRVDPARSVPALGHGVDEQGRIIVVCTADEAERMGDTPVRIDGVKKGMEVDVDIIAASIHALGLVTWCEPDIEIPRARNRGVALPEVRHRGHGDPVHPHPARHHAVRGGGPVARGDGPG
ncbi:hypothetical protein QP028_06955 [Corynebacterium suedekumii]|nr:hypothetical protein QP028_06955 [Corynebacterium suedekumii]